MAEEVVVKEQLAPEMMAAGYELTKRLRQAKDFGLSCSALHIGEKRLEAGGRYSAGGKLRAYPHVSTYPGNHGGGLVCGVGNTVE